jgi:hypothetical protein
LCFTVGAASNSLVGGLALVVFGMSSFMRAVFKPISYLPGFPVLADLFRWTPVWRACTVPTMRKPRAYTVEEMREMFLDKVRSYRDYWLNESRAPTIERKLDGLCFSILNIFDGTSIGTPAFDLVPSPHPDDKEYHQAEGENWWEPACINGDVHMHDQWSKKK